MKIEITRKHSTRMPMSAYDLYSSCRKVMLSQTCVKNSVHGEGLPLRLGGGVSASGIGGVCL